MPLPAPLSAASTTRVLQHFGLTETPRPDLATLRTLVARYTRTVPWESASRIVRRAQHESAEQCAIIGADFWDSHFEQGTGGTCYESNYAFFSLLLRLGYQGYLTINNMGEAIGCHSAIIVVLERTKYLVDVGYPVHAVLPLNVQHKTKTENPIMNYTVEPLGERRYDIRRLTNMPHSGFTLVDEPVAESDYRAILIHDYRHDGGQFLNEIVIHKVVDRRLWRFNSDERPLCLQQFVAGKRRDHPLGEDAAGQVAARFGLSQHIVAQAMTLLGLVAS